MLPIRTSIKPFRTPYANYAIIVANIVVFVLTASPPQVLRAGHLQVLHNLAEQLMLTPARPHLWQFVGYAFLHANFLHIAGNMFFLYLFGNNVNDKLGHIGYVCFYLAGAVFSAIGHTLVNSNPVIGASGAVAAVTGAYLVLFPQTLITVIYWFLFIGTMDVPAIYFIVLKMIFIDNMIAGYTPNVAYDAHLAGYGFGIAASLLMLATGLTESTHFDLWAMIKQWNRRRQYRDVVSTDYDPFMGFTPAKRIKAKEVQNLADQQQQSETARQIRDQIAARISEHNLPAAAQLYLELTRLDPNQLLSRQYMLDVANQLAGEGKRIEAADAYEKFLAHYGNYEYAEQVELMLGLIYSRYLNKPDLAVKHLKAAEPKLADPAQLKMCRDEIDKLQNR
jgi:membrane associated rhomboid family serine protease